MEKKLLGVSEAALELNVSRSTVYKLIGDGYLPVVRLGAMQRLPARAVRELTEGLPADPRQH